LEAGGGAQPLPGRARFDPLSLDFRRSCRSWTGVVGIGTLGEGEQVEAELQGLRGLREDRSPPGQRQRAPLPLSRGRSGAEQENVEPSQEVAAPCSGLPAPASRRGVEADEREDLLSA